MQSFWQTLSKPIFVLAPMADVTDPAFRFLIAKTGKPDVTWTEFVSADGLYHIREKKGLPDAENPLMRDLLYSDIERPIVAQLFGSNPETMRYAAALCKELGFDGIDLNMGCPDRSIEKQGCGAGMIKNPTQAKVMYEAAATAGLPVSIKTRIGYNHEDIDGWLRFVLTIQPAALTVHLRTRAEMSKVPAHWELMPQIVALRNEIAPHVVLLGNGDVATVEQGRMHVAESGCDGAMLGRAVFGNPWLFSGRELAAISPQERIAMLRELTIAFDALRPTKSFHILKKHVKAFISGWDDAAATRAQLMDAADTDAFLAILDTAVY